MIVGDFQNSLIQQADKLDNLKMKESAVSFKEAKSALNPDVTDTDRVNSDCDDNTGQDYGEKKDIDAVQRISVCNRCGVRGHFARNCATPNPGARAMARTAKGSMARAALHNKVRATSETSSCASVAKRKVIPRRSAGRRNVRGAVTSGRVTWTRLSIHSECMGFDVVAFQ